MCLYKIQEQQQLSELMSDMKLQNLYILRFLVKHFNNGRFSQGQQLFCHMLFIYEMDKFLFQANISCWKVGKIFYWLNFHPVLLNR